MQINRFIAAGLNEMATIAHDKNARDTRRVHPVRIPTNYWRFNTYTAYAVVLFLFFLHFFVLLSLTFCYCVRSYTCGSVVEFHVSLTLKNRNPHSSHALNVGICIGRSYFLAPLPFPPPPPSSVPTSRVSPICWCAALLLLLSFAFSLRSFFVVVGFWSNARARVLTMHTYAGPPERATIHQYVCVALAVAHSRTHAQRGARYHFFFVSAPCLFTCSRHTCAIHHSHHSGHRIPLQGGWKGECERARSLVRSSARTFSWSLPLSTTGF